MTPEVGGEVFPVDNVLYSPQNTRDGVTGQWFTKVIDIRQSGCQNEGKSGTLFMKQSHTETGKIGKKGVFTIPASLRKRFGLHDGSLVIAEERADGILLRPAVATVIEMYDDRRTAGFLLSNAIDTAD